MKFAASLVIAFATAYVSAITRCGDPTPPESLVSALNETDLFSEFKKRNIDTYVHVVTSAAKEGMYPQSIVNAQMDAMNAAYGSSGFGFNLRATTFSVNDKWAKASQGSQAELIMKRQLRLGSYADLNLYFLSDLGGGLLGFCYFPVPNPSSTELALDGCINLAGSMPGADEYPEYNLGYTAVHETGHWLGLFHVFQGFSCKGRGDYIPGTKLMGKTLPLS
jgi:hypothetical protein